MHIGLRATIALGCSLVVLPQPASARSPVDDARKFGLIGTWAIDCKAKPSSSSGFLSYRVEPNGRLVHKRDFGNAKDQNEVTETKLRADGKLEVIFDFKNLSPPHKRRVLFMRLPDGSIRSMENQVVGSSDFSVKDGKLIATGNPTPVQRRCAN